MDISELNPNPKNPRKITDSKLKLLKKSLAEFGDLSGIVFNRKTKQLVGGHQRVKLLPQDAAITVEKKYKTPTRTGTVAEGFIELNGERVAYREVEFDEVKEKAANIAANKGAGDWDMAALTEWMRDIDEFGLDLDLTMFDEVERDQFFENERTEKAVKEISDKEQYIVVVVCKDENEMKELFEELHEKGHKCRLIT